MVGEIDEIEVTVEYEKKVDVGFTTLVVLLNVLSMVTVEYETKFDVGFTTLTVLLNALSMVEAFMDVKGEKSHNKVSAKQGEVKFCNG